MCVEATWFDFKLLVTYFGLLCMSGWIPSLVECFVLPFVMVHASRLQIVVQGGPRRKTSPQSPSNISMTENDASPVACSRPPPIWQSYQIDISGGRNEMIFSPATP